MAITVKHTKVSLIPDTDDDSLIRPSDWNDDHALTGLGTMAEQDANAVDITGGTISGVTLPASNITGTLGVPNGGTGASTLTGYVKGTGTTAMTASATIPNTDITGLGSMSTQNANNVAITGGSISGTTVAGYIPTTEKAQPLGVATLDAGGKVPTSQIPMQGDINYQGTWNANTNTPTLVSSTGVKGYYYVVDVAGTTNLDGITDWQIGDWAIYNGTVWQKVDNTDAVTSVNGKIGTVVLTTTDVAEGTNQYFTTARARTSVSAGTGISYDNTTGVITNSSPSLGGDVVGPTGATDNAVARYDATTGKLLQNSVVLIGDTGSVTGVNALTAESLTVNNNATLGSSNTDTLDVNARITTDLEPNANNAKDIGTSGRNWRDGFFGRTVHTVNLELTGTTSFDGSQGTSGQVLTSAGTGNTPTWTTPTTGTVTSVAASGGTGISVSGSPITSSGTLTITNTAPDQTVSITGAGGASVSGTYPNFTITTPSGTVTSVTGTSPVVSSGGATPAISLAANYGDTQNPYGSKTANFVLAAPNGTAGAPTFRAVVAADIPTLNQNTTGTAANVTGTVAIGNGGTGATTAPTARTNLGATTVGGNMFTLTNPSAITFPRFNANNTVSALDAASFRTAIGAGTSSTTGTVTSVGGTGTVNGITLTGTVTTSGNLTLGGTLSGVNLTSQVTGTLPIANGGTGQTTATAAFNALNPMTTTGDILYEASPTTAARLGIGSTGQVLTVAGGIPSWANAVSSNITPNGMWENATTIASNYTIGTNNNAMSAGPITVNTGVTVTVPTGSTWTVV